MLPYHFADRPNDLGPKAGTSNQRAVDLTWDEGLPKIRP